VSIEIDPRLWCGIRGGVDLRLAYDLRAAAALGDAAAAQRFFNGTTRHVVSWTLTTASSTNSSARLTTA
jgi:hypothetical protein